MCWETPRTTSGSAPRIRSRRAALALPLRARLLETGETWLVRIGWRRAKVAQEAPHGGFGAPAA